MTNNYKFICAKSYNFNSNGKHYEGCNAFVFDEKSNTIQKARVINKNKLNGLKFGDTVSVTVEFIGRYVNFSL